MDLPDPKDLPNFGWMTPWLGRGAEPTPAGFKWLADQRFVTVVNLRSEDDTESYVDAGLGLTHVRFSVEDNAAPTLDQAKDWLTLCADAARRPIFVHCQSGHGRTSTFCILVRLAQGKKLSDAIDEQATRYGFKPKHDVAQVEFLTGVENLLKSGALTFPPL